MMENSAAQRAETTYQVYLCLHGARDAYPEKTLRVVISELMYSEIYAWRAVGITRAALDIYHRAGRNRVKGIERAHLTDRAVMVRHILYREAPLPKDDLFTYWRETDRVVIAEKRENRSNTLGDWIPFDNDDARFFPPMNIGFRYRSAIEGELVRVLVHRQLRGASPSPAR
ncbi:hypothetical protein [Sphingobium yanoikuyae]|uniref:Uncharacterized protein n=1 Tax=Sphingobium yanoikuyae ATCC 51230 TaxID=883163 RepID=K9CY78_SPHYA|nr:hypothetical protein [Sphingobium yanoikuyae]EKU75841.1 hypothetical protein HMPREF9718_01193 [Sphingobium yanoikuyae ATCC 51230]WQE05624.1 hypothetical protein U0025_15030 [Sphingobium yanoikuyae]